MGETANQEESEPVDIQGSAEQGEQTEATTESTVVSDEGTRRSARIAAGVKPPEK